MNHDRIHARKPAHDLESWSEGTIVAIDERDGHCAFTVETEVGELELTVTFAIRELVLSRLALEPGESPVGERVWYKKRGG